MIPYVVFEYPPFFAFKGELEPNDKEWKELKGTVEYDCHIVVFHLILNTAHFFLNYGKKKKFSYRRYIYLYRYAFLLT